MTPNRTEPEVPAPRTSRPTVVPHDLAVLNALQQLAHHGQAMAFVAASGGIAGVVTMEDLGFAWDWAGPTATVADAMTFATVEVGRGASVARASEAFAEGLRRWIDATGPAAGARS